MSAKPCTNHTPMQIISWSIAIFCHDTQISWPWFRLSASQIVGILIRSVPKPCIVPAPSTVKLLHASSHSSGNRSGHVAKTSLWHFCGISIYKWVISYSFIASFAKIRVHCCARGSWANVTPLAVPSSCSITKTPMGVNNGIRWGKRKFSLIVLE